MIVFRIALEKYAVLTSSGAENRWNKTGEYVIYTGGSRSLSTLELVAHRAHISTSKIYKVMQIFFDDDPTLVNEVKISTLPTDWRSRSAYGILQNIGSDWYTKNLSLILKVPSAIIPQEFNYIINTKHPNFSKIKLIVTEDYVFDNRLL